MEWCLSLILCYTFIVTRSQEIGHDYRINFHYNNTYKYNEPYVVLINKNTEYIMEFGGDVKSYDTPARVTVASQSANRTYPVFITTRQQKGVFSWQLPMLVQTPGKLEQFTNISRTLCPHNNVYNEELDTCDVSSTQNTPIIHLTTSSPEDIEVTLVVETVEDFFIPLNKTTNLTSTPSQPKYYFYPFKQNASLHADIESQGLRKKRMCNENVGATEDGKWRYASKMKSTAELLGYYKARSVILMIESDDDICAVVSIQNFTCPVFDNERDILYDGYYLTMTRRGGITLTQDSFPLGFYIVFIVKSSDEDCTDEVVVTNSTSPNVAEYLDWSDGQRLTASSDNARTKSFSFKIVETISYHEYVKAAGITLFFFLTFYVAFFVALVVQRCKKNPLTVSMTDSRVSEEGRLSPIMPQEDVPPGVRRRSSPNQEMSDSTASTSQQCLVGDGDAQAVVAADQPAVVSPHSVTGCSSSSDSESEYSNLEDMDTEPDVYRLPAKLCVANLARKRAKVLSARSKMYLWNVLTVAVFYTLPVIQLVITYQRMLNQSGNQDLCYFNFFCAHPWLVLSDFNHVYSNLGYVLLGTLFLMQVLRRHRRHATKTVAKKELGIPQHFGLLYAMGIALVSEGFLSAAYHVCPNSMNFQFDTSFMYVTSVLCMVKIYQSRHPDINARAHATFGVLAVIIFIGLVGVLNANFYFWIVFTALHIVTCFILTFQIYYMGRFRIDGATALRAFREFVSRPLVAITPTYCGRCVMLILANLANWVIAVYGAIQHNRDFGSHLLLVLMTNLFLYTLFYIVMKILNRETIRWYTWVFIALTYSSWFGSSYFYFDQSTNWALTPAQSRRNNTACTFLQLYDSHDIWHLASSIAMFFSFNMYLTIDDNLSSQLRSDIMAF